MLRFPTFYPNAAVRPRVHHHVEHAEATDIANDREGEFRVLRDFIFSEMPSGRMDDCLSR
jgi:uncharacterized circularly permuted ATP-grasp superfamily protein